MTTLKKTTLTGLLLAALAGTTGCATTSDLDALRADVAKANATAEQAAADAAAARRDAEAAKMAAESAAATAADTNAKLDQVFKKSMYK